MYFELLSRKLTDLIFSKYFICETETLKNVINKILSKSNKVYTSYFKFSGHFYPNHILGKRALRP